MNLIVNVDSNWAIGYRGKLLVSIPEDMKFFRSETTGKVVVLGRKTLDTFPGGQREEPYEHYSDQNPKLSGEGCHYLPLRRGSSGRTEKI